MGKRADGLQELVRLFVLLSLVRLLALLYQQESDGDLLTSCCELLQVVDEDDDNEGISTKRLEFPPDEADFRGNNVRDPKWTDETVCHDWLVGCSCAVFDSETKLFLAR